MWARNLELALGLWLALSPFVFAHPQDASFLWANDLGCAAALVVLALVSYWPRARRAHLAELVVAVWLVRVGWLRAWHGPATPASQNQILVGLLVALFAIVPCRASEPPPGWRRSTGGGDPS